MPDQQLASGTPQQATEVGAETSGAIDALGERMRDEFGDAKNRRHLQEEVWLEDLRQYKGIYDPAVWRRIGPNRCKLFVRLTRGKLKGLQSKMMEMLFPKGDKNWSVEPSPVSEVTPEQHFEDVMNLISVRMQAGIPPTVPPSIDEVKDWIHKEASKCASGMSKVIDDQLNDVGWLEQARRVLHSGHMYGTGIMKGPITEIAMCKTYGRTPVMSSGGFKVGVGKMQMQLVARRRPGLYFVPHWNVYPDPFAREVEKAGFMWERNVMGARELLETAARLGFNMQVVGQYLRDHPHGDLLQLERYEVDLRMMGETDTLGPPQDRYELLERWGTVMGWTLKGCGHSIPDHLLAMPFEICLHILGGKVVKSMVNPLPIGWNAYKFYYLDKDETSIWGEGLPRVYRDMQSGFNAAFRMALDNGAISSGPLIEANRSLLDDEEDVEDIHPWRVFVRSGIGADANAPALRVYNVASHVKEHVELGTFMKDLGDEASTVPSYSYGAPSTDAANTLGGLSMLLGQVNLAIKDVAYNWDGGVCEPVIAGFYDWNMAYHPDESIKGDFQCKARGATSLVAKELRAQAHTGFLAATNNPIDAPFTKRDYLLREAAKSMDLEADKAVVTEDEAIDLRARGVALPGLAGIPPGGLGATAPNGGMNPAGGPPGMAGPQPPQPPQQPGPDTGRPPQLTAA